MGEAPEETEELTTVLQYLHASYSWTASFLQIR
jgi:hypothetical protein